MTRFGNPPTFENYSYVYYPNMDGYGTRSVVTCAFCHEQFGIQAKTNSGNGSTEVDMKEVNDNLHASIVHTMNQYDAHLKKYHSKPKFSVTFECCDKPRLVPIEVEGESAFCLKCKTHPTAKITHKY